MRTSWKFGLILRISIQTFLHKIILTICFFTSKYNSFRDWLLIHRPNQFDQMAEFFTSATSFSEKYLFLKYNSENVSILLFLLLIILLQRLQFVYMIMLIVIISLHVLERNPSTPGVH